MDKFKTLGQALWLYACSPLHRVWPIESAVHYIIPPIELGQFSLLVGSDGLPRGWASWAWFNKDVEKRYILDPNSLQESDWKSGDRLWFIDFISPFGFKDTVRLRRLMGEIHGQNYLARSIRLRRDGKAVVLEHSGGSASLDKSKELKERFFKEASEFLKEKG